MKKENTKIDLDLSLQQLENDYWKDELPFPSGLVENVYKYRKIPLKELTTEQLRLLIGQNVGLQYLTPIALAKLRVDILTEGDLYKGDLLSNVLDIENVFWTNNIKLKEELRAILVENRGIIEANNENNIHRQLLRKMDNILNRLGR